MILASGSPRRLELMSEMGLAPTVRPANVDETPRAGEDPCALVERLARSKARACRAELEAGAGEAIVAADTIVWLDGLALGKPADAADARTMLRRLSGRSHHVSTGVCILAAGRERSFVQTSTVTFHELSEEEIDAYVASGEPLDKAGAYGIQGAGRLLVRSIEGDYFNIVGLPVSRLARELEELGALRVSELMGGGRHGTC